MWAKLSSLAPAFEWIQEQVVAVAARQNIGPMGDDRVIAGAAVIGVGALAAWMTSFPAPPKRLVIAMAAHQEVGAIRAGDGRAAQVAAMILAADGVVAPPAGERVFRAMISGGQGVAARCPSDRTVGVGVPRRALGVAPRFRLGRSRGRRVGSIGEGVVVSVVGGVGSVVSGAGGGVVSAAVVIVDVLVVQWSSTSTSPYDMKWKGIMLSCRVRSAAKRGFGVRRIRMKTSGH
ncbi:MAG: hypothetical protein KGO51_05360 [Alphaproteobacteria bacterium]|nr:hypothetical protein [Alphaproteobacteria bacterium]